MCADIVEMITYRDYMQNRRSTEISASTDAGAFVCARSRRDSRGRFAGSRASNAKPTDNVHTTYLLRHTYVCICICTRRSNIR